MPEAPRKLAEDPAIRIFRIAAKRLRNLIKKIFN